METHFGSTIEKIRLQKGIPINQFIQGIMDASTYHRFKTGKIDTTITKFTALLNRLNVRFEEFLFINRNFKQDPSRSALIILQNSFNTKDLNQLKRLYEEILEAEWVNPLARNHIIELIQIYINVLENKPNNIENITLIQYLKSIETWTHYEIAMFSNSLKILPTELIDSFLQYMFRSFLIYQEMDNYQEEMSRIVIQAIISFLSRGEVYLARKWYKQLRGQAISDFLLFEKFFIKLLGQYLEIAEGEKTPSQDLKKYEDMLNWLDCKGLAHNIENINQWIVTFYKMD